MRELAVTGSMKQTTVKRMLAILRQRVLPELTKSLKSFLGTNPAEYDIQLMADMDAETVEAEYVYLGIEKGLLKCIDPEVHNKSTIFLQINIDGVPMT